MLRPIMGKSLQSTVLGLILGTVAAASAAAPADAPVCRFPALDLDGRYPHVHARLEAEFVLVVRVDGTLLTVRTRRSSGNPGFDHDAAAQLRASDCGNARRVRGRHPADVRAVVEVPVTVSAAAKAWAAR